MSDDRMFERDAQAWLELGPSRAPARAVQKALQIIDTTPQQRDLRILWRFPHVTINKRFAVAAAVGLLVLGAGLLILRPPQSQVGTPTPSPTVSPGSTPLSLVGLQGAWASVGERADPILQNTSTKTGVETFAIDSAGLRMNGWKGEFANSASIAGADGQLTLRMDAPQESLNREHWDCTTGDSGTYNASLSPDEQTLTLASAGDACASRSQILNGDWTRWGCPGKSIYAYCDHVSELTPGRYVSQFFRPFWGGTNPGPIGPASGQLAYTVPAGWAKLSPPPTWPESTDPSSAWLTRLDAPDRHAIEIFSNTSATAPVAVPVGSTPKQCVSGIASNGTATQIADLLESLDYLSVSNRTPLMIGGLTGVLIDVSLTPGFFDPCNFSVNNIGQIIYTTEIQLLQNNGGQGGGFYLDYEGNQFARLILVDTDNGRVVIAVSAPDAASLSAQVALAMPVIRSFEFIP